MVRLGIKPERILLRIFRRFTDKLGGKIDVEFAAQIEQVSENVGDFVALEVNMRPAGGYTPDMMNFAHSTDVYQIWADAVTYDKRIKKEGERRWCVYASRKDWHTYRHTHEEILKKYGSCIVMCERMPELMWATMGCQMYTAKANSEEEVQEFIQFVHQ